MMSRRRKLPSPHRFEQAAITGVAADLEALAVELAAEESARGEMSDLDELSHALNVAIDGLSFLQHVLESQAANDRGRDRNPRGEVEPAAKQSLAAGASRQNRTR